MCYSKQVKIKFQMAKILTAMCAVDLKFEAILARSKGVTYKSMFYQWERMEINDLWALMLLTCSAWLTK